MSAVIVGLIWAKGVTGIFILEVPNLSFQNQIWIGIGLDWIENQKCFGMNERRDAFNKQRRTVGLGQLALNEMVTNWTGAKTSAALKQGGIGNCPDQWPGVPGGECVVGACRGNGHVR